VLSVCNLYFVFLQKCIKCSKMLKINLFLSCFLPGLPSHQILIQDLWKSPDSPSSLANSSEHTNPEESRAVHQSSRLVDAFQFRICARRDIEEEE
jgi:hypothetical protein